MTKQKIKHIRLEVDSDTWDKLDKKARSHASRIKPYLEMQLREMAQQ